MERCASAHHRIKHGCSESTFGSNKSMQSNKKSDEGMGKDESMYYRSYFGKPNYKNDDKITVLHQCF